MGRLRRSALLLAMFLLTATFAHAALLGLVLEHPLISFSTGGSTTYDAATNRFVSSAGPLAIQLAPGQLPKLITPTAMMADLVVVDVFVDDTGTLSGGAAGDDLMVTGRVDLGALGVFEGKLLTGEAVEFGFRDSGTITDDYELRFAITGGLLAFLYDGSDLGISINSEDSNFVGDFTVDFSGEAKGNLGAIAGIGRLGDFVWLDTDGDGIQGGPGEPGIGGVTLTLLLDFDKDGTPDATQTTVTLPDGSYIFDELPLHAGYTVIVDDANFLPGGALDGLSPSPSMQGGDPTLDSNGSPASTMLLPGFEEDLTLDFGFLPEPLGSVGDFVFNDVNGNGIQDAVDLPIEGVLLVLSADVDGDGNIDFIATDVTDVDGLYLFPDLPLGGKYTVDVDPANFDVGGALEDFEPTLENQGSDPELDSNGLTAMTMLMTGFEDDLSLDFGFVLVPICELDLDQTCCVPPPPSMGGGDDCQGKVVRAVFEYTGGDCSQGTNDQEGKHECSGDPGAGLVSVVITRDEDKVSASPSSGISDGETFTISKGGDDFGSETEFDVVGAGGTQSLNVHTSCSKALNVGDQFGSVRLVELETTDGGVTTLPDPTDTLCVPPGDQAGTLCDSRLTQLVLEFTGGDCSDSNNAQGDKAKCSGDFGGTPVDVEYTGKDPSKITVAPDSGLGLGSVFAVTATGRDELHSNTKLEIDGSGGTQSLEIHTSCSAPLALGDQYGAVRVVGFTTKDGGKKELGDPNAPIFQQACSAPAAPPGPHCTSKVDALTLRYIGGDCTVSNTQEGKATCSGDSLAGPVDITITKDEDKVSATPAAGIAIGDLVTIAKNSGELGSETKFDADAGSDGQSIVLHTSCSKPLNLGDRFGAFEVFAIDRTDEGLVSLGALIEFQYTVSNPGGVDAVVDVVDDDLGPIATGLPLPAGESVMLFATDVLETSAIRSSTVTGTAGGAICPAETDSTPIILEEPPVSSGPWECDKPIDQLTMIWDGSGAVRIRAWKGSVGSTLLADLDGIVPSSEVTVAGFAGSPNDVFWEVFVAGTTNKLGESNFHLSCSDSEMNGDEDCGKRQGNGKGNDSGMINDWLLEGVVDNSGTLDCTP